jgi:Flp pilus assembly protein TadD
VRRLSALLLSCALAGCAIEFGVGEADRGATATTAGERNRLYIEEQERIERDRQTFQPVRASDR